MRASRTAFPLVAIFLAVAGPHPDPLVARPPVDGAGSAASLSPPAAAPLDPCSLLDREALLAVQGVALLEARASDLRRGGLRVSSCFFRGADHARSVSLEVALPGEGTGTSRPRERWREMFHADARSPESGEEGGGHRFARAGEKPVADRREGVAPIDGLGDEAYYIGTAAYGALYVLHGDRWFRLSCGGPGDLAAKLARSRALAERVISKLSK